MDKKNYIFQYAEHENCDWNILRAMLSTLSSDELNEILDEDDFTMVTRAIYSVLNQREEKPEAQRPHYLSVKQLLSNYQTKGKKRKHEKNYKSDYSICHMLSSNKF